mmetsp:Transcript_79862/g.222385  ORF Transcript_79862/g.222385 Transcript_79862/m.222385 type:complete len:553 (-) Transcript_79862:4-1662(-)
MSVVETSEDAERNLVLNVFKRHDRNKNGTIEISELVAVLKFLDSRWDEKATRVLFRALDTDNNQSIAFEDLLGWLWGPLKGPYPTWGRWNRSTKPTVCMLADGSLVITPASHKRTLIFLHGGFQKTRHYAEAVDRGRISLPAECKIVVPQAPTRDLELPQGIPGLPEERSAPCWFKCPGDLNTAEKSVDAICQLIREEVEAVGPDNIHIAGFSQGGCIAWVIFAKQLAPFASFTCQCAGPWLVPLLKESTPTKIATPALLYLGTEDLIFSPAEVRRQVEELGEGCDVSGIRFHVESDLGHELPGARAFDAMHDFIGAVDRRKTTSTSLLADGSLVCTPAVHRRTLFFLHGAFQSVKEYADSIDSGRFLLPAECKVVVPQAPTRLLDLPLGIPGVPDERNVPCWFNYPQDASTAEKSVDAICDLILEEAKLVGPGNVHIAGFSQGACVAWVIFAKQLAPLASFTCHCAGPGLVPLVKPGSAIKFVAPALMYLGTNDLVFSPDDVKNQVAELGRHCDASAIRFHVEEGLGHEFPRAEGFDAMVDFIDSVDRKRK